MVCSDGLLYALLLASHGTWFASLLYRFRHASRGNIDNGSMAVAQHCGLVAPDEPHIKETVIPF